MKSTLSIADHIALSQNRWLTMLIADFNHRQGARYVELLNRLGISRDSLGRTLEAALAHGWIARNAGYGHPLRPEYIVTDEGRRIAERAVAISKAQAHLGLTPASLTRWGMPIIQVLRAGEERFGQISHRLRPATSRSLSQGLRSLEANALVDRLVVESRPPFSRYTLTDSGILLANAAG
ncbi:transcriptional regulator [Lysobacter pythonis]|uniref:Transcriptional regulator n=1 Tax=Solilutibacter pythonis TaxID=2483112 RepID=A0A3M2I401_9GAMM|nr:winged helix-turn-helix transcriptional regulator [Lysobacter pythonis]RMH94813.1 transcriptional regulator [Lysobacter pythonis]